MWGGWHALQAPCTTRHPRLLMTLVATPFTGKSLVEKPVIASQEEHDQGILVVPKPVGESWEDVDELKVGGTSIWTLFLPPLPRHNKNTVS